MASLSELLAKAAAEEKRPRRSLDDLLRSAIPVNGNAREDRSVREEQELPQPEVKNILVDVRIDNSAKAGHAIKQKTGITEVEIGKSRENLQQKPAVFEWTDISSLKLKHGIWAALRKLGAYKGMCRYTLLDLIQREGCVASGNGSGKIDLLVLITAPDWDLTKFPILVRASVAQLIHS